MLSYELCKQLRDAGFPQLYEQGEYFEDSNAPEGDTDGAYRPTLSELIDACMVNDGCFSLEYNHKTWWAKHIASQGDLHTVKTKSGDTADQAVARLWLLLNKKLS